MRARTHANSDDDADMVRRRVNAIMEATPMHLITAYFEHAYEISDDFGPGGRHPDFTDQPEEGRYLADPPDVDAGARDECLSSASPWVDGEEDPADVLARLQDMPDRLQDMTHSPSSGKEADPAPRPPSIHLPAPSLDTFEDAKDVLARVHSWADPETPAGIVGAPPKGQEAQEDVASILARAQAMTSKYMTGVPCAQPTDESAPSPPPSVDNMKREDAKEVLARVNDWLARTSPDTEASSDIAAGPTAAPSAAARGVHTDEVLKRVDAMMGSASMPSISAPGPAQSAPLLRPPVAAGQEDAASILARAQGMAEALARVHAGGLSPSGHDALAASQLGATDAAATAEDVNRVLERVDAMMSKLEEKHARPGRSSHLAVTGAQYEGQDEAAEDAAVLPESTAGILARAKAMAQNTIRSWAASPTSADAGIGAPTLPMPAWAASEAAAAVGEDAKTVLARADAWISPDAPAKSGLGVGKAGAVLCHEDAGAAASGESVADVLRRVQGMMATMDCRSEDQAGVAKRESKGEEEEGWRDGRWARERTAKTCCSWEMGLVLRQAQQQPQHNTPQH